MALDSPRARVWTRTWFSVGGHRLSSLRIAYKRIADSQASRGEPMNIIDSVGDMHQRPESGRG